MKCLLIFRATLFSTEVHKKPPPVEPFGKFAPVDSDNPTIEMFPLRYGNLRQMFVLWRCANTLLALDRSSTLGDARTIMYVHQRQSPGLIVLPPMTISAPRFDTHYGVCHSFTSWAFDFYLVELVSSLRHRQLACSTRISLILPFT